MNSIFDLKRTINLIEKLTYLYEDGKKDLKNAERIISDIYKFAHLHSNCKNPHTDWRKERIKCEKELKDF